MPKSIITRPSRRTILKGGAAVLAAPFIARISPAVAAYPDRPIRFLVPWGPGGPVDVVARLMAPAVGEALGASVFIENRPGASGNIGTGQAARAEADGYTVLVQASSLVINPVLFAKVPYDLEKDFVPLADLADAPSMFAAKASVGAKTLAEFAAEAKKSGRFSYSHSGIGTVSHLTAELFKNRAGFDMAAVAHNGSGPAAQSLLSGAVEFCSAGLPALHQHVLAGTVTGLGITSANRWFDLPGVPSVIEAGYPGSAFSNLTAMLVPTGTPPEIAERISKAALDAVAKPEVRTKLQGAGFEPVGRGPAALKERIAREIPIWRETIALAGIKVIESN